MDKASKNFVQLKTETSREVNHHVNVKRISNDKAGMLPVIFANPPPVSKVQKRSALLFKVYFYCGL